MSSAESKTQAPKKVSVLTPAPWQVPVPHQVSLVEARHPDHTPAAFPAILIETGDIDSEKNEFVPDGNHRSLHYGSSSVEVDLFLASGMARGRGESERPAPENTNQPMARTDSDVRYKYLDMIRAPEASGFSCGMVAPLATLTIAPEELFLVCENTALKIASKHGDRHHPSETTPTRVALLTRAAPCKVVAALLESLLILVYRNPSVCSAEDEFAMRSVMGSQGAAGGMRALADRGAFKFMTLTYGVYPGSATWNGHNACLQATAHYANADLTQPDVKLPIQVDVHMVGNHPAIVISGTMSPEHTINTASSDAITPHHLNTRVPLTLDALMDLARQLSKHHSHSLTSFSQDAVFKLINMISDHVEREGGNATEANALRREVGALQSGFSILTRARLAFKSGVGVAERVGGASRGREVEVARDVQS